MVDRDREADRSFRRKRNGRFERETEPSLGVALAAEDGQRPAGGFVPADREAVEFGAVVVGGEAGALLESMRMEVKFGLGAIDEMLLPARDQRLLEPRAERLARV